MPIYLRTTTHITPPPSSELSSDDEGQFVRDPSQVFDILPQPYRMINKLMAGIFDDAWDVIEEREADRRRSEARYIPPELEPSKIVSNQTAVVNCVRASLDGKLLFVAINNGVAALECESDSLSAFCEPSDAQSTATDVLALYTAVPIAISVRERIHQVYPLCTLDASGTLRLWVYLHAARSFVPCKSWTPVAEPASVTGQAAAEDDAYRKLLARGAVEFSGDLEYLASHVYDIRTNSGESFVEVFRLPKDAWLREAEAILAALPDPEAALLEQQSPSELQSQVLSQSHSQLQLSGLHSQASQPPTTRLEASSEQITSTFNAANAAPVPTQQASKWAMVRSRKSSEPPPRSRRTSKVRIQDGDSAGNSRKNSVSRSSSGVTLRRSASKPESAKGRRSGSSSRSRSARRLKFSEPQLLWKLKPVSMPSFVNPSASVTASVSKTGRSDTAVTGEQHLITQLHGERRNAMFDYVNAPLLPFLPKEPEAKACVQPSMTFLSAGRLLPLSSECTDGAETSTSLALWWSGGFQLFVYSLVRQSKEPVLEACVPFSSPVVACSASPCSSLLALLLQNETLVVFDKNRGIKRKLLNLNDVTNRATGRHVVTMELLPCSRLWNELASRVLKSKVASGRTTISTELLRRKASAKMTGWENNVQVLVAFSNGSVYLVNTLIDEHSVLDEQSSLARNDVVRVHETSEAEFPGLAKCFYLHSLPGLIILVRQDGRMFVHDLLKPRTNAICELKVPDGYELTMSWKHVLATGNFGSRLLVRVSANGEDSHDDLLIFDLKSAAILEKYACRVDKYEVAADWEASKKRYNVQETMDAFVSRCINERMAALPDRQTQFKSWWAELQTAKQQRTSAAQAKAAAQQKTRASISSTQLDMHTYSVIMNA